MKEEVINAKNDDDTTRKGSPEDTNITPPFSIYTRWEKWFIVSLIAFIGLFSPLTANIYFPAIPLLVTAFNKSTELINLTVVMYMILQGIAPMVWGPLSDRVGRRPTSAACLFILSMSCIGLARVPTSDYWLLMVLRCLQAAGSASTIAIGAGVIGDISTAEERGGFFGVFTLGPMIGPAIGPVIGGVLTDKLGWRQVGGPSFGFYVSRPPVMPETLRRIVGNGSIYPPAIYRPIIPVIGRSRLRQDSLSPAERKAWQNPLRLFTHPDIILLLLITAISCAVFYGVLASISTLFSEAYPFLNETTIGLCFMAIGGGMAIGSSINGKILDHEYQTIKRQVESRQNDAEKSANANNHYSGDTFPIEKARLRLLPALTLLTSACCAGYGWCLQKRVNIAGPLVLQVIMGYISISQMNSTSTLMIDLSPGQSSAVTGCNNLVRCLLSAVVVSVIDLIIKAIGIGWTYVLLAGFSLMSIPLIYMAIKRGPTYRERRRQMSAR